jgi:hypothetical protein
MLTYADGEKDGEESEMSDSVRERESVRERDRGREREKWREGGGKEKDTMVYVRDSSRK